MKKLIMAVVLGLMFIAPANADPYDSVADIMLICWADSPEVTNPKKEKVSIILNTDDNIATMIDPHNNMVEGKLTVSEYFYTITIEQLIYSSKIGVIKINRLSGVLSAVWTDVPTESRPVPLVDAKYGACDLADHNQLF